LTHMRDSQSELLAGIRDSQNLSDEDAAKLKDVISAFKSGFQVSA
jgi:F0F1-type ATP synthase alpha subunit